MKKELIIAAWDRNYDWISELNDVDITIYNKNNSTLKEGEIFISPNVGRDVHTFFMHICKSYDNLPDYLIVSQDHPFDHVNNYIEIINGDISVWDKYVTHKYGDSWFFNTQMELLSCDKFGHPHHGGLPIESIWNQLFKEPCPNLIEFVAAGHFIISKEQILKRPKLFYEKVVSILETNSLSPWIIERLEGYIFNEKIEIK